MQAFYPLEPGTGVARYSVWTRAGPAQSSAGTPGIGGAIMQRLSIRACSRRFYVLPGAAGRSPRTSRSCASSASASGTPTGRLPRLRKSTAGTPATSGRSTATATTASRATSSCGRGGETCVRELPDAFADLDLNADSHAEPQRVVRAGARVRPRGPRQRRPLTRGRVPQPARRGRPAGAVLRPRPQQRRRALAPRVAGAGRGLPPRRRQRRRRRVPARVPATAAGGRRPRSALRRPRPQRGRRAHARRVARTRRPSTRPTATATTGHALGVHELARDRTPTRAHVRRDGPQQRRRALARASGTPTGCLRPSPTATTTGWSRCASS